MYSNWVGFVQLLFLGISVNPFFTVFLEPGVGLPKTLQGARSPEWPVQHLNGTVHLDVFQGRTLK